MRFQPAARLQELALFKNLSPAEVEAILQAGRQKKINAEEFFFMQDDPANAFYVLTQGKVRPSQFTSDGQQILVRIIVPITPFGR